jgi:hypothetical protein
MAVKTFTTGEVLTSADTNTYLNNGGLVYITQGIATSGGHLHITGCFTSLYDSYRVVISQYQTSTTQSLEVRLSNGGTVSSTAYYWMYINGSYTSTATYSQIGGADTATWPTLAIADGGSGGGSSFDLHNPKINTTTEIVGTRTDPRTSGSVGPFVGYKADYGDYDGIYFSASTGTFTSLKVRIYGYRQA